MTANKTLLRMKYARIVSDFAEKAGISLSEALDFFYGSVVYKQMSGGISDMHCRSDGYLVEDLLNEYRA